MSEELPVWSDSPVVFDGFTASYARSYSKVLEHVEPAGPIGYLDPLLGYPPAGGGGINAYPPKSDETDVFITGTYERIYLRDLAPGAELPSSWLGFKYDGSSIGMFIGFVSEDFSTHELPTEVVAWVLANLSPGQCIAVASCCEPGMIYILGCLVAGSSAATQTLKRWVWDGVVVSGDDWPAYVIDETVREAEATAAAVILGGAIGKNWPGSSFRVSAYWVITSNPDGCQHLPDTASDEVPEDPIEPWDCVLGTYTKSWNNNEPAVTWDQWNWDTGLTTGVTVDDGAVTDTITVTVTFG